MKKIIAEEVEKYGASAEVKIYKICKAVDIPENSWTAQASKKALKKAGVLLQLHTLPGLLIHQFIIIIILKWL